MMVKLTSFVVSRPVLVFVALVIVEFLIPGIVILKWCKTTKSIKDDIVSITHEIRRDVASEIKSVGETLFPTANSSAIGLANLVESSLSNTHLSSFSDIQNSISPILFQAFSTIPRVSQVSYIAPDGLFFSFFTNYNTSLYVFANNTFSPNCTWYLQQVDLTNGHLRGDPVIYRPLDVTATDWFRALSGNYSTGRWYASLGTGWGIDNATLFLDNVSLYDKKGAISLGFRVDTLALALKQLNLHGGELYMSTAEGRVLLQGSLDASFVVSNGSACFHTSSKSHNGRYKGEVHCFSSVNASGYNALDIGWSKFRVYYSALEVAGVPLVYALVYSNKGETAALVGKNSETALILLVLVSVLPVISTLCFVLLMVRAARREMYLCSALINQMEATQQAERKSMNKSLAFASASHDIRGALAAINGLIDLCREEAKPDSELDSSLRQMKVCTQDLVGLLNSILDMSKIESGKMQVEEEEFDLAELLEEVADSFHPIAMKRGIDVVLDPHDGSILRFSNVRGDRGKLKQILNNLTSNAVKFTSEGHVLIRAWAQKPGSKSSIVLTANADRDASKFSRSTLSNNKDNMETPRSVRGNINMMEFVFEVDDTGKGIPKEMQKLVFENYVQVRETARGQQGTGLGLGIVQSLVRLMGGEIKIVDKEVGQRGTCFRFNIFLTTSESPTNDTATRQDEEAKGDYCLSTPNLGLTIRTSNANRSIRNLSPRLNSIFHNSSPRPESSRVVLLLKDEERRRVTQRYVASLGIGINLTVVGKWEDLECALEKVRSKLYCSSPRNSSAKGECNSRSEISRANSKELPLSAMDGTDHRSQLLTKRKNSLSRFVLLVVDANTGPFSELSRTVQQFRDGLNRSICCKVVWLNKRGGTRGWEDDVCFLKPLQGSRLNQVMKMLPEFGGTVPKETPLVLRRESSLKHKMLVNAETQEEDLNTSKDREQGNTTTTSTPSERETRVKKRLKHSVRTVKPAGKTENVRETPEPSDGKFLRGKKVLVVEDQASVAKTNRIKLMRFGASTVDMCDNGKEAVEIVTEKLEQRNGVNSEGILPYDYIFMDCQMPEMDGREATIQIREAESKYGIHIPIIAVSAHEHDSKEVREAIEAGMDFHVDKDLNRDHLVNALERIQR